MKTESYTPYEYINAPLPDELQWVRGTFEVNASFLTDRPLVWFVDRHLGPEHTLILMKEELTELDDADATSEKASIQIEAADVLVYAAATLAITPYDILSIKQQEQLSAGVLDARRHFKDDHDAVRMVREV